MAVDGLVRACGLSNVSAAAATGLSLSDGVFSPLLLWGYDPADLASDLDPEATLYQAFGDVGLDAGVTAAAIRSLVRLSPLGARAGGGLIALTLSYSLNGSAHVHEDAVAFERCVSRVLSASAGAGDGDGDGGAGQLLEGGVRLLPDMAALAFSETLLSDDLAAAVSDDVLRIMLSIVLMSLYMATFLGRHRDALRCRAWAAGAAVLSVVLATFSAFGIAAACGVEYNDNVNLSFFVMLGVGLDDAFVIVDALEALRGALHATGAVHYAPPIGKAISPFWVDSFSDRLRASGLPPLDGSDARWIDPSRFQLELDAFLQTSDAELLAALGSMIVREGFLVATSWRVLVDDYGAQAMLRLRATLSHSAVAEAAFAYSDNDIYFEQDAVMLSYAQRSLVTVLAAVLAAVLLLTLDCCFVALMACCTLSCVAHLLGWMVVTSINLSSVSLVPLLLSVGLCIDYMTHIAHAFFDAPGSPLERTVAALRLRATAVLNAGVSTGLSVLLLAFGSSTVFTTFFWMLLGVVVVGLFHALLVLPMCLSLLPRASYSVHARTEARARTDPTCTCTVRATRSAPSEDPCMVI